MRHFANAHICLDWLLIVFDALENATRFHNAILNSCAPITTRRNVTNHQKRDTDLDHGIIFWNPHFCHRPLTAFWVLKHKENGVFRHCVPNNSSHRALDVSLRTGVFQLLFGVPIWLGTPDHRSMPNVLLVDANAESPGSPGCLYRPSGAHQNHHHKSLLQ